ncbi:28S ribosomal protein S23, mitochondrial-like [Orbicella faveolata]|uniref:28S ribosomal protein S23, mitochondrial-like n=1 Tax=Orbicella faveolata TaxID=48498 RepID=UPI0009E5A0A7|nr:28S ribosomal protein S23, mitochondrial-like [Orbicella faveolata]
MAGSRHLRGTVLSRVSNLLRAGAISEPLWFPVVQAFPPLTETKINRKGDEELMHKITYPEDEFRKFVDTCMDLVNQGMNKEEAIENTVKTLFTSNTITMPDNSKDEKDPYSTILDSVKKK